MTSRQAAKVGRHEAQPAPYRAPSSPKLILSRRVKHMHTWTTATLPAPYHRSTKEIGMDSLFVPRTIFSFLNLIKMGISTPLPSTPNTPSLKPSPSVLRVRRTAARPVYSDSAIFNNQYTLPYLENKQKTALYPSIIVNERI